MPWAQILSGLYDHLWATVASVILFLWGLHDIWHFYHQHAPRDRALLRDGLLLIAIGVLDALELFHAIPAEARLSASVVEANAALARLQEQTAPRHLSQAEKTAMLPILKAVAGKPIAVGCRLMDGESCDYADDIATMLKQVGCIVPDVIKTSVNDFSGRIVLVARGKADSSVLWTLQKAFAKAGLRSKVEVVAESSMGAWYPDIPHVIVGRK